MVDAKDKRIVELEELLKFAQLERDNRTSAYEVGVKIIGEQKDRIAELERQVADLRSEVARECAEIADREADFNLDSRAKFIDGSETWLIWESRRLEAELIAATIRAKFGVTG